MLVVLNFTNHLVFNPRRSLITSPAMSSPAVEGTKLMLPGVLPPFLIGSSFENSTFTSLTPRWRSSLRTTLAKGQDTGLTDIRYFKFAGVQLVASSHRRNNGTPAPLLLMIISIFAETVSIASTTSRMQQNETGPLLFYLPGR